MRNAKCSIGVTRKAQSGMLLLEALIAILIFSVGILGMVSMQAMAIKNTADASYRSEASHLADQIIGQMWIDRGNLPSYILNSGVAACSAGGSVSVNPVVSSWLGDANRLPGGDSIKHQISVGLDNTVTVTVCWLPPRATRPHNFTATTSIS